VESAPQCNDRTALGRALKRGQRVAFEASKSEVHVWSSEAPRNDERCVCGARRWGAGDGASSRGDATPSRSIQ